MVHNGLYFVIEIKLYFEEGSPKINNENKFLYETWKRGLRIQYHF